MELNQVRYFLTLCRELNFTRAAELCHVSQPALTKAIKNLEEELGGELFRRERSNTHLTDLGRLIQPHLERVFSATETAREEASSFRKVKKAPLRLGVMCTISPQLMIGFLRAVRDRLPVVEVSIKEYSGTALIQAMMKGDLDAAAARHAQAAAAAQRHPALCRALWRCVRQRPPLRKAERYPCA